MSGLFIVAAPALLLFLVSYLRSGRFGATVLALGVGYLLAMMWTDVLAAYGDVSLPHLAWRDIVYSLLVLSPGVLALLFSHKQKSLIPRSLAAVAIAVLGIMLLLPIFAPWMVGQELYATLEQYQGVIITALLLLGLLDMVFSRLPKASKGAKD